VCGESASAMGYRWLLEESKSLLWKKRRRGRRQERKGHWKESMTPPESKRKGNAEITLGKDDEDHLPYGERESKDANSDTRR